MIVFTFKDGKSTSAHVSQLPLTPRMRDNIVEVQADGQELMQVIENTRVTNNLKSVQKWNGVEAIEIANIYTIKES